MGRTALRGQESGSGAQSLRSPPTSGRAASPRPLTSNCHRGSEPRRRPELRRAVPRHLGMVPPRPALGERDQPRGLARPSPPHPTRRAAAHGPGGHVARVPPGRRVWRAPTWQHGGRERRRHRRVGHGRGLGHVGRWGAAAHLRRRHAERGQAGGGPEQSAGDTRHRVLRPGVQEKAAASRAPSSPASPCGAAPDEPAPRERAAVT